MSRCAFLWLPATGLAVLVLFLAMAACGTSPSVPAHAIPSYALTAAALSPASISAGNTSTSAITITPANGYAGTIRVSCTVNTAANPAPPCSFSANPITVTGTAPAFSTLMISTSSNTPVGSEAITVTATDGNNAGPSNGPQALKLTTSPPSSSYTIDAAVLSSDPISAGNTSNSAITVTPQNGYSGAISLSCSIAGGPVAPACSFSTNPLIVTGNAPATAILTISTSADTAGGSYVATVAANDAQNLVPSNGNQAINFTTAAVLQHIIILFQENRTPDNLFHGLPNADIANSGINSLGQEIPLQPVSLQTSYDVNHGHTAFLRMYDGGKMDGADLILCAPDCPPNPQFQYVNPSEVATYFQLAQQYTFGDRMFQTNQGGSFPAHQFIISGTSAPTATSNLFAAENPYYGVGCTAPPTAWVWMIDPQGYETSKMYPCFEHPTLPDLLDAKGITWRYYTPSPNFIWTGPNAIQHLSLGPDWTNNVIQQDTQVLTDISNQQLPAVSWVIPTGQASDHAQANDGSGPSWVASVVNAVGTSPYWANTAIILTWDDWGGWYDHVPPPQVIRDGVSWGSGYVYGFRVPLIVIAPYAKAQYVSHMTHDFGSILKFIETTFNLPSLCYADTPADDLSDCFTLTQSPITFQKIAAPLDASHFLDDKRTPTDPDDD